MYHIRLLRLEDNPQMAQIIRTVSQEFGLAAESGFAVADPVVDHLYSVYSQDFCNYWVVIDENDQLFGGGGLSPLQGDSTVLEIQKMYFLTEIRGQGFAKQILERCFEFADTHKFNQLYLETTKDLWQAVKLYEKLGFKHLNQPMGNTGHSHACEIRMLKTL